MQPGIPKGESPPNSKLLRIPDFHARVLRKILDHASAAGHQTFLGNHNHLPEGLPDPGQKWAGVGHSGCPQWSGDGVFLQSESLKRLTPGTDSLMLLVYGGSIRIQVDQCQCAKCQFSLNSPLCAKLLSSNYLTLPEITYWD